MKTEKLDNFLKRVTGLKTGDFSKATKIPPTTLRERWNNPKKRSEVIYLAVGYSSNEGEDAINLIKEFC
ncbi:hypothetical protein [Shewanella frigidimarina]|uniref:hypothetical protein n=1 Tax=Shewanella frigidimarina TaxID=56812 RepID=UPI003D7A9D81